MTTHPGHALRRIRADRSLRQFVDLLTAHGLPAGTLSRQRISQVEQGTTNLPPEIWKALRDALRAAGHSDDETAQLAPPPTPIIDPAPPQTPTRRRDQWHRLLRAVPGNRWWLPQTTIAARVLGEKWIDKHQDLTNRFDIDVNAQREQILRRLAAPQHHEVAHADRVQIRGPDADRNIAVRPGDPLVFALDLTNAGEITWTDRMLYRLGPPVSSSLPFAPGLIPIPNTEPGETTTVLIAGRAQVFPNLAAMTYIMVFPNCSPCLPGSVRFLVDTRHPQTIDRTIPLPARRDGK